MLEKITEEEYIKALEKIAGASVMLDADGTICVDGYFSAADFEAMAKIMREYQLKQGE